MNDRIDFESVIYGEKRENSIIKVIGVGGGGGNAVSCMYEEGIKGVHFMIANTDRQVLEANPVPSKLVLGESGLGAGAKPEVARELAEASREKIIELIGHDTKLLFITAGMGKGTGTGAAPVIAEIAKEMGILTIAVVTFPFKFEGRKIAEQATEGINKLKQYADTTLVVKNQNIMKYYKDDSADDAFAYANDVLKTAVKCIAELITIKGDQNIDFNDIDTIMRQSGVAMFGMATAAGENRVDILLEEAFKCPLLEQDLIVNAKNFLFDLTYGSIKISELDELTERFDAYKSADCNVIWGRRKDETLGDNVKLIVIATNYSTLEEPQVITLKESEPDAENREEIITGEKSEEAFVIEGSDAFSIHDLTNITLETELKVTTSERTEDLREFTFEGITEKEPEMSFAQTPSPLSSTLPQQSVVSSFHDNKFENDDAFKQYVEIPAILQQQQSNVQVAVKEAPTTMSVSGNILDFDDSGILYGNFPD